ncbi:hypothetical protein DYB26_000538 [Aphanomyces astaci]|uniref:Myb-like domain-containing protein n=1 Tax=Aphanomyces astaci TaxID=112090 RepID=A0A418E591_APHAT|nr:hypothetical protein DYB26_000538 [Aphanomyces astaci]
MVCMVYVTQVICAFTRKSPLELARVMMDKDMAKMLQEKHNLDMGRSEDGVLINTRWTPEQVLKPGLIKGHWAADEDDLLIQLVQATTTVSWGELSKSIDGRTYDHTSNHLDPSINKGSYSSEEDMLLTAAYAELGNRWTQIADRMPVCNPRHVPQLSFAPIQATPGGAFTDTPRHLHQRYPEDEPHFAHPHPDPSALDPDAADLMSRRASSMFESFKERDSSLLSFASVKAEDWEFFRELVLSDHFAQAMPAAPVEMVSIFDSFKDTSMTDAEFRQLVGVIENPDAIMDFIHETYASVNEDGGCPAYIPSQLLSDQLDTRLVLGDYERSPEVPREFSEPTTFGSYGRRHVLHTESLHAHVDRTASGFDGDDDDHDDDDDALLQPFHVYKR